MPYVLGIDVGTCRTAAAIAYLEAGEPGDVVPARLGTGTGTVPSVLSLAPDGSLVLGREPDVPSDRRAARGFSRRVGDEVPLSIGGELCTAQALVATTVMWVVERVAATEGAPAEHIAVTHPASWGAHRKGLLQQALRDIGLDDVRLLPEPVAAAVGHAARQRVEVGDVLAVYNLGAEEFEAAVVRRTGPVAFELLGWSSGGAPVGGCDLDDALVEHVRAAASRSQPGGGRSGASALADPDPADPQLRLGMAWLREECTRAKEQLSVAGEATVQVRLPQLRTEVVVTRAEFEELVLPWIASTVDTLLRTVRSCGLRPGDLAAALLVGGSSRIPLVADLVAAELDCPAVVAASPEAAVAAGAAAAARNLLQAARPGIPQPVSADPARTMPEPPAGRPPGDQLVRRHPRLPAPPPRPPVEITPILVGSGAAGRLSNRRPSIQLLPELKPSLLGAAVALMITVGVLLTVAGSALA
jgi:molecular chaperone DnaK (HSP70)